MPCCEHNKKQMFNFQKLTTMKELAINIVKNSAIENIVCTPNTVVLAKQTISTNARTGEVTTTIRYIEVCPIEKTDPQFIVKSVLKFLLAEFFVCNELQRTFAETNITQRKLFNQFLGERFIYRTNSEGKIAAALESEIPLRQTGLNVKIGHNIVVCKPENRKAAIHQHTQAVMAQFTYRSLIVKKAEAIDKEAEKSEAATASKPARRTAPTASGKSAPAIAAA
ncbi:hypothetical protein [Alistipes senegalensis]|uniref:hypothetical protein n=1 Tax=Alistipes senegalensis TaxID=1288121 RepID=UPI00101DEE8F|nr:hypothetical protein [Alistipes senegalensis]